MSTGTLHIITRSDAISNGELVCPPGFSNWAVSIYPNAVSASKAYDAKMSKRLTSAFQRTHTSYPSDEEIREASEAYRERWIIVAVEFPGNWLYRVDSTEYASMNGVYFNDPSAALQVASEYPGATVTAISPKTLHVYSDYATWEAERMTHYLENRDLQLRNSGGEYVYYQGHAHLTLLP